MVPELVSRLSPVFTYRFYNNEDRLIRIEMLEELTAQEVLGVWMSWRHHRFPPVLSQQSPDSSPTPSVTSDAKTEPVSNKKIASVAKLPPRDSSSSNSEIRNRRKKNMKKSPPNGYHWKKIKRDEKRVQNHHQDQSKPCQCWMLY
jgi:hypothetical protein